MNPFQDWLVDQAWNRHPVFGAATLLYFAWHEMDDD
jgi:hypothetical protein